MRLPYIPAEPSFTSEADQAVLSRVLARRGGTLIELDRTLLHAPPVADGWNSFLGSIRTGTTLPASIRELAICRVAVLNQAWYEWGHHAPILEETKVMSAEAVQYLKDAGAGEKVKSGLMDEKHAAVMEYTDAMTRGCVVKKELFAEVKRLFSEREVVEITATVAAYNCVSRFLVALDVGEMGEKFGVDMN